MKIRRIHQAESVIIGFMGFYYLIKDTTPLGTAMSSILLLVSWNFWQGSKLERLNKEVFE